MTSNRMVLITAIVLGLGIPSGALQSSAQQRGTKQTEKPNVVFLVVDDFSVETGSPADTFSAFERIGRSGVKFTHAYANHPVCAPSRASMFTGILGQTSGNLFWDAWFSNKVLAGSQTLMEHFKMNGYKTFGTGKLLHHDNSAVPGDQWDDYGYHWSYGPFVKSTTTGDFTAHPAEQPSVWNISHFRKGKITPVVETIGVNYGSIDRPLPEGYSWSYEKNLSVDYTGTGDMMDRLSADWAVRKINEIAIHGGGPFFLAVGIIRPHVPLYCPSSSYDSVPPVEAMELTFDAGADCGADDFDSEKCGSQKLWTAERKWSHTGNKHFRALQLAYDNDPGRGLKEFQQAYHACKAFAMTQMHKVLDAIDQSPFSDNTIIVATSDNGWINGLHQFVYKNTVWEDAAHVPFYIRAPGIAKAGTIVDQPVSLVDIYPTLKDLCGLSGDTVKTASGAKLDGHSLRPLLEGIPSTSWDGPNGAASMAYAEFQLVDLPESCHSDATCHHWAVRTKELRYIMFNNGQEELYDMTRDPYEMHDIAQFHPDAVVEMRTELRLATGLDISKLGKQL